mmetsp:Transcript_39798/g.62255  ORF Transcript_39798/g.62255 Transcript_39798/m.62255 type:complete len:135 (-) Transcript_39798:434-838(-)|eukprot:CAMPEP_0206363332 /NCGR_PEP_ID=MMETSP0294-20121207/1530_1 /ASSEMBLY_ACC=CAM_ASM_000327 /TAXON_ID=39354 /ORGANISM="Heterosigma akashiwo, Strain CCMP2393" /LENGTH=134 /DNA_ID=CAMNT_0053808659 /DNA_START=56 /DNA_END=460 /DNA_ORIENTATION=+
MQVSKSFPPIFRSSRAGISRCIARNFAVTHVPTLQDYKNIREGDGKAVLYFTAKWCGPCRRIAPVFEDISEQENTKGITFAKIDVDENSQAAQAVRIKSVPFFIFTNKGTEVNSFAGADVGMLEESVESLAKAT